MRAAPRLRDLNPLRLFTNAGVRYQQVPSGSANASPFLLQSYRWPRPAESWGCWGRFSMSKLISALLGAVLILALLSGGYRHVGQWRFGSKQNDGVMFYWQHFDKLSNYYNGIRTLVPYDQYVPSNRYNQSVPPPEIVRPEGEEGATLPTSPPTGPVRYDPYPAYNSTAYTRKYEPVHPCYLDAAQTVPPPDVYAYPGLPQDMPEPFYGNYAELGLPEDMCFERYGRFGAYGLGYDKSHGGLGVAIDENSEHAGNEKVFERIGHVNYADMDWAAAQERCAAKNARRFEPRPDSGKERLPRHAYVLRAWIGYAWTDHQILTMRAMINELSLKSGGEYDVHILLHVKDESIPIWASDLAYRLTIEQNVPREFWDITTLWSEQQMRTYYPDPFGETFANLAGSSIHGVYRSAHFALQWFSQEHPEYDFFWNWEMDLRYSGHYYEFNTRIGEWAKRQPRKGLWERNKRFWMPKVHGTWQNFTDFVEQEIAEKDGPENNVELSGPVPVWGPVSFPNSGMLSAPSDTAPPTSYEEDDYSWGVGEEADLLVFNPLFDTAMTNWVFSYDVTGYDRSLPIPPRRTAIITVARLSKRLLDKMHEEVWRMRHTMFPEMWPPSVCLHHGYKAVYVPHPVFFDRDWNLDYMNQIFNYPKQIWESPFGWGEHNMQGGSFYYNSGFSGALWRRWLGQSENGEGGHAWEEARTGRMCLRGTLHHPIKHEFGPTD